MADQHSLSWSCPLPAEDSERIQLAHGGGGKLTLELIERLFLPVLASPQLEARHDGAIVQLGNLQLAFTTDSYVVRPIEFPGGSIGELAVYGTVNDLAMCGAKPLFLSVGFILEEGLPLEVLKRVAHAIQRAARQAGVTVVTGDTKVVERGKGDQVFLNTSGIGVVELETPPAPARVSPGDAVIVSGDLGRHGVAILAAREGLELEGAIETDAAPLWEPVAALLRAGIEVHCLRDLTRGGLASALNEIARTARVGIEVDESAIVVSEPVAAVCEMLGLDPLYVANEGRFVAFVPWRDAERAVAALRQVPVSSGAVLAGRVRESPAGVVVLRSAYGSRRVLDLLSGEQLPRIC